MVDDIYKEKKSPISRRLMMFRFLIDHSTHHLLFWFWAACAMLRRVFS